MMNPLFLLAPDEGGSGPAAAWAAALKDGPSADVPGDWTPSSWRQRPIQVVPAYGDPEAVERAAAHLGALPPLVTSWEIERLRGEIAEAAEGRRFILQGGDCAEVFSECRPEIIASKLKILLQMSLVLMDALKRPTICIGRFAGQYAKPRSSPTETQGGQTLPSYFGDLVNGAPFTAEARAPDPDRLILSYHHAAMTLNFIRALAAGGFADLHHPEYWDLEFLGKAGLTSDLRGDYRRRVESVGNAIRLMEVLTHQQLDKLAQTEFYTSHEGLSLPYESGLTRRVPRRPCYYDLSCHLPWIGDRTRATDGAHVEFFRGVRNPVGVKIGPSITPDELLRLLDSLDRDREPGDLILIPRLGAERVGEILPALCRAVKNSGHRPAWVCDPMHGNTIRTAGGGKTRRVESILREVLAAIEIHAAEGCPLGGVHFELTAENVTECVGGASGVQESDLDTRFLSRCDPRLNYEQSMEMAFAIASRLDPRAIVP